MSSFHGDLDKTRFLEPSDVLDIVLENVSHGIVVVGNDYRLLAFNRVMDPIFQLPRGTFRIGLDFRDIIRIWVEETGQSQAMLELAIRDLDAREPFLFEYDHDIHGDTRWVQLAHNPLPQGGFVRTFTDITERKRVELALQEVVEDLNQANTAKDQFLRLVSHDLRSPISGLAVLLRTMLDFPKIGEADRKSLLEEGVSSANSLLGLTEHLLRVSEIRGGSIIPHKQPIPLRELAEEIHTRHKTSLRSKGIRCEISIPAETRWLADRVLIGEVIDNLFSNALKFCETGDGISVRQIHRDEIEVADTGPGIPEPFREHLFRRDVKTTRAGTRGERGSGLGLPHCADVMEAHGGEIRLLAGPGGARFAIRLPHHARTVLIVDDQAAHRAMIRSSIARVASFNLLEAGNGRDALETIEAVLPDIAIIDLEMPEMDGTTLLKALRARPETRRLPIIVASSHLHGDPHEAGRLKRRLLDLGANLVETKPIHAESFNRSFLSLLGA